MTDRDIVCKGLASNDFDARRAKARDVMTDGIHCCREDDDLAKAVRHMETLKIRRLPVINKSRRMVGMISLGDISHSASGICCPSASGAFRPITEARSTRQPPRRREKLEAGWRAALPEKWCSWPASN